MSVEDRLRVGLASPTPDPPLPPGTPAGVLVPVIDRGDDAPTLLFTVRSHQVRDHKGEISFPGGVRHEEDPDLLTTAIRETEEELGVPPGAYRVLGALPPVHTVVSGYVIVPFVGVADRELEIEPSPVEIAEILEIPIKELLRVEEEVRLMPAGGWFSYTVEGHTVWGATGRIVHAFLEVYRKGG